MPIVTIVKVDPKKSNAGTPYLRVQARPGGWMSIWGENDTKLVRANGIGAYEGTVEQSGDFKNLSNLSLAEPSQIPAPTQAEFHAAPETVRIAALNAALAYFRPDSGFSVKIPDKEHSELILKVAATFERYILEGSHATD